MNVIHSSQADGGEFQYVDILCKDLGLNSRRKSNFISEIFAPYKPEDFNGFVDEYLDSRAPAKAVV